MYFGEIALDEGVAEMRSLTTRALELDPALGEAHVALGILKLFFEWDWEGAGRALRRAVALNPNDAHAHHRQCSQQQDYGPLELRAGQHRTQACHGCARERARIGYASGFQDWSAA
jgi:hypothetical protein